MMPQVYPVGLSEQVVMDKPTGQSEKRILLVDDEQDIRDVLSITLTDMGYEVLEAENGRDAMALFKAEKPMITLTDIKMPGMDGIDVLKKIKNENPYAQVIMITGHGDTDIAIRSLKHEAVDFITKPISNESLEIALKRANEKILTRRQLSRYTESLEELVREKTMLRDNLSSLGVMIGSISHSAKGLLTRLDGGLYLVESALKNNRPDQIQEGLDILKLTIDRLKKMIFDILYYSKERELQTDVFDLIQFAGDVADTCESKASVNQVRLIREFEAAPATLRADPEFLRSALINILDNAVDACVEKGAGSDRVIHFSVKREPGHTVFEIRDNGVGMDQETRDRVFNLFFSSKQRKGTGFGLFISKNIVEQHGGFINLRSARGKGSCFTVKIPM